MGQQVREKRLALRELQSRQVDDTALIGASEKLEYFLDARRTVACAERHRAGCRFVDAIRIDDAKRVSSFAQSLQQSGSQRRLAAAGRTGQQNVFAVWMDAHLAL